MSAIGRGEEYDVRGNVRLWSVAESLWSVRLLRSVPDSLVDDFWRHLEELNDNTQDGIFPSLGMDWTHAQEIRANESAPGGVACATVVNMPDLYYKTGMMEDGTEVGMDAYIDARTGSDRNLHWEKVVESAETLAKALCLAPNGQVTSMCNRKQRIRNEFFFHFRGRSTPDGDYLQQREETWLQIAHAGFKVSKEAGITEPEDLHEELRDFFLEDVEHGGKVLNLKGTAAWEYRAFRVPFIGGASGSLLYAALSMEDTLGGQRPSGVVPISNREALLALHTAILVAGGQHSLSECLLVLQAMGYFAHLPRLMRDSSYADMVASFESHLVGGLGLGTTTPLQDAKRLGTQTRMEQWAVSHLAHKIGALYDQADGLWKAINNAHTVLLKDHQPTCPLALKALERYTLALNALWVRAWVRIEVATAYDDPLGLFGFIRSLDSSLINESSGGRQTEVYASVLLNMMGEADAERLRIVAKETKPFKLMLNSLRLAQSPNNYFVEATFSCPAIRRLHGRFYHNWAPSKHETVMYQRKDPRLPVFKESVELDEALDIDAHATLAFVRADKVEEAKAAADAWNWRRRASSQSCGRFPTSRPVRRLVLETGRSTGRDKFPVCSCCPHFAVENVYLGCGDSRARKHIATCTDSMKLSCMCF